MPVAIVNVEHWPASHVPPRHERPQRPQFSGSTSASHAGGASTAPSKKESPSGSEASIGAPASVSVNAPRTLRPQPTASATAVAPNASLLLLTCSKLATPRGNWHEAIG